MLWLDGDSMPERIREIAVSVADLYDEPISFVTSHLHKEPLEGVHLVMLPQEYSAVDDYILEHMASGDVLVSNDKGLIDRFLGKEGLAVITLRGLLIDKMDEAACYHGGGNNLPYNKNHYRRFKMELRGVLLSIFSAKLFETSQEES